MTLATVRRRIPYNISELCAAPERDNRPGAAFLGRLRLI